MVNDDFHREGLISYLESTYPPAAKLDEMVEQTRRKGLLAHKTKVLALYTAFEAMAAHNEKVNGAAFVSTAQATPKPSRQKQRFL